MTMAQGNNLGPGEGRGLLVFDADDTLWWTQEIYDMATAQCRILVEQAGFDGDAFVAAKDILDVANVQHYGLSPLRFPISCRQAYEQLAGAEAQSEVAEAVQKAAGTVFTTPARLVDDVHSILASLVAENWRLVMQTSGDRGIQEQRIGDSGLAGYFSEIKIVPKKTSDSFAERLVDDGRAAQEAWSVGNSLPSDINPALRVHMNAIWVPAHIWGHEKRETVAHQESGQLYHATYLKDILGILQPELAVEPLLGQFGS